MIKLAVSMNLMHNKTKIILEKLENQYGLEKSGLIFSSPFELLIATMLSAQCTDVRVNLVTAELIKDYNTPQAMIQLTQETLKEKIRTCGLSNTKAKNILKTSYKLLEEYDGIVPKKMESLIDFPGVGRKTANVVLSNAFNIPAIAVDTHVFRVSKRLGLAHGKNVTIVEQELMKAIPQEKWSGAHHWLIWHGRKICTARNPKCKTCFLKSDCENPQIKK